MDKNAEQLAFKVTDEIGSFKDDTISTLSVEVRKGEKLVKDYLEASEQRVSAKLESQMAELRKDVQQQIQSVKFHTYDTSVWMHNQLFHDIPLDPTKIPQHLHPNPVRTAQPTFSPAPESSEAPPAHYSEVWESEKSIPTRERKRKYGEGPSASRSVPKSSSQPESEHAEVWSPTSKSIILDTLKLVNDLGAKRDDYYSYSEWNKYEQSVLKVRLHDRDYRRDDPSAPPRPKYYFPKPYQYFLRQERMKEKN